VTDQQSKNEHRERIVHACRLAINHAALLCGAMSGFVERLTSDEALDRPDSLVKIEDCVLKLDSAELHLIQAVEKLYELHRKKKQVDHHHYADLLMLCWNGVGDCLDRRNDASFNGPLQSGEQTFQNEVVLPLIKQSFETFRVEQKELKKQACADQIL
jgi:hypothetical protein